MKKCSVVYSGLQSGIQFVEGNYNSSYVPHNNTELTTLSNQFKRLISPTDSDETIDILSKKFLSKYGWTVVYSDYDNNSIFESMTNAEVSDFISKLKKAKVKFKYTKVKDGSTRVANGTLNKKVIQKGLTDVTTAKRRHHVPSTVIVYWDLDKHMFRSFRKSNFIKIISYNFYENDK